MDHINTERPMRRRLAARVPASIADAFVLRSTEAGETVSDLLRRLVLEELERRDRLEGGGDLRI